MKIEGMLDRMLSTLFRYVEKAVLVLVGGLSLLAIGQVLLEIPVYGKIRLEDVLLIFIFVEIMAMANVYFVRHAVPFTYPMFIAVTALSRLVVLQGKDVPFINLIYEGVAILLISISILIIRFSQRYSHDAPPSHNRDELKARED
jgi:protein PsiE